MTSMLENRDTLFELLAAWSERDWLRELDRTLAHFFADLDPQASPLLLPVSYTHLTLPTNREV